MVETIGLLSKGIYLCTIILAIWAWMISYNLRSKSKALTKVFWMATILVPLYSVFATLYVFDIGYGTSVRYIGWTVINTLFIYTILVLLKDAQD